jgi:hypothetical protein
LFEKYTEDYVSLEDGNERHNKCDGRLDLFIENVNSTTVGDKAEIEMTR